jgi:hypothetical protein
VGRLATAHVVDFEPVRRLTCCFLGGTRLFVDFNATACVIIRDRDEFRRRLKAAGAAALPGARGRDGKAIYIDPLRPRSARIDVPMSKNFKYASQAEQRFVWEPSSTAPIACTDLKLGRLKDIAELVLL